VITEQSSLSEVAFAVCTALAQRNLEVVLVGGSAAAFYSGGGYQSFDADFVCIFYVDRERQDMVIATMKSLGYRAKDNMFVHSANRFTVDFPRGPIGIGSGTVTEWNTIRKDNEILNVVTATDCVRDRLAKYYFWNDLSALEAAKAVFRKQFSDVDLGKVREWSVAEGEQDKFEQFHAEIQPLMKRRPRKSKGR
jgi:hypothetical protein